MTNQPQRPGIDLIELRKDIAKFEGTPPFDNPSNFCYDDYVFARALEEKYGTSLEELRKLAHS